MLVAKMAERDMKQRDGAQTESENRMHLVRRAILTGLASLSFGFYSSATESFAQAADGAVVAQTENVSERPAPATDSFGRTQFILSGDPIVPPRAYSKGTDLPRAQDYDANESGTIYDILFIGIEKDKMQFEIRGYSGHDLQHPASGQTMEFPFAQSSIEIRDLTIKIEEVTPGSLTYKVQPLK